MKVTREAPDSKPKKKASKKLKLSPKSISRPANPAVVMDEEFRRHPTTGTLDLRLAVTKVIRPHRLVIENIDIEMPDGSTRVCEFYNISTAQEGRFAGRDFESGLQVGSAFIIRDVPRRPAAWKNSVLRYINSCCVPKLEPKPEPDALQSLTKRVERLEAEVAAIRKRLPKSNS